jgi:two-component system OmpR family response regulator
MMPKKIAIIEDEDALARGYKDALERVGYLVSIYPDLKTAQHSFEASLPDLAIIDIQLGNDKEGGYKLCGWLRRKSPSLPIIFYTGLDSEIHQLAGAQYDADEYLIKGQVSIKLLRARVDTLLRLVEARKNQSAQANAINLGPLGLASDCYSATWNGQDIGLTVSEFLILQCLIKNPGRVYTRDNLTNALGVTKRIAPDSINTYIRRIREKICQIDPGADPITSKRSIGYFWAVEN